MNPQIFEAAMWYLAFLFSTTCHEAAHAWTASRLGDDTAARCGLATLNPLPHIRFCPFGMVGLPLLTLVVSGGTQSLGYGMAPYRPEWAYQWPKRAALMALAGPASNLLIATVACLVLRLGLGEGWWAPLDLVRFGGAQPGGPAAFAHMLVVLLLLNAILAAFNMMPVPPFDGAAVVALFLPAGVARNYLARTHDRNSQIVGQLVVFYLFFEYASPRVVRFALWCVFA